MKKRMTVFGTLLLMLLIFTGCGKKMNGTYNSFGADLFGSGEADSLLEMDLKGKEASLVSNYYQVKQSGFLGTQIDVKEDKKTIKGKVNSSDKTITFSTDNADLKMSYKLEKDTLTLTSDDGVKLEFYPKDSDEYKKNKQDFKNQLDELKK